MPVRGPLIDKGHDHRYTHNRDNLVDRVEIYRTRNNLITCTRVTPQDYSLKIVVPDVTTAEIWCYKQRKNDVTFPIHCTRILAIRNKCLVNVIKQVIHINAKELEQL